MTVRPPRHAICCAVLRLVHRCRPQAARDVGPWGDFVCPARFFPVPPDGADPDGVGAARTGLCDGGPGACGVAGSWSVTPSCAAVRFGRRLQLVQLYGYTDKVEGFRAAYAEWGAWIIFLLKGLTPIPYKVVTITSGFAGYSLALFILFPLSRGPALFSAGLFRCHRYGEQARIIIEKRLGLWVTLGAAVVVIGLVAAVYLI